MATRAAWLEFPEGDKKLAAAAIENSPLTATSGDHLATKAQPGLVVQIHPEVDRYGFCFAIVESVNPWGIVASVVETGGDFFVRLNHGQFEMIGIAAWTREPTSTHS
jgi:hypothetical protein